MIVHRDFKIESFCKALRCKVWGIAIRTQTERDGEREEIGREELEKTNLLDEIDKQLL